MPRLERSLLAQLRNGVLPLKIETGRYNKVKVDDYEDENHFSVTLIKQIPIPTTTSASCAGRVFALRNRGRFNG